VGTNWLTQILARLNEIDPNQPLQRWDEIGPDHDLIGQVQDPTTRRLFLLGEQLTAECAAGKTDLMTRLAEYERATEVDDEDDPLFLELGLEADRLHALQHEAETVISMAVTSARRELECPDACKVALRPDWQLYQYSPSERGILEIRILGRLS
jgi:hypothetical protein